MIVVAGEIIVALASAEAARAAAIEMGRATRVEVLKAHFETPHMKTFRATLATLKFISRDVTRYELTKAEKI